MAATMIRIEYWRVEGTMLSIQGLWDLFHIAQQEENADAALCFRYAIDAYNRCDHESVQFWYRQAQLCESAAALSNVIQDTKSRQVAMHEAGHVLFAARMGATSVTFSGAQTKDGQKYRENIKLSYPPSPQVRVGDYVLFLAAGGAAARMLAGDPSGGDGSDAEMAIESLLPHMSPQDATNTWTAAQRITEEAFRIPDVAKWMNNLADDVESKMKEASESPHSQIAHPMSEFRELAEVLSVLNRRCSRIVLIH